MLVATTLYASTPPDTDADTLQRQVDEDICRVARQRWKQAVEEDARLDELMLEDLRFENGEQWEERTRVQRERDRRTRHHKARCENKSAASASCGSHRLADRAHWV